MDNTNWWLIIATVSLPLFVASLLATIIAMVRRSSSAMALAAVLSLPLCVLGQVAYLLLWLIPSLQLAAAVALRWRVGASGSVALLLAGLLVGLIGGPGAFFVHQDLLWVFPAGLLVGFIALAWRQPPRTDVAQPQPER